MDKPELDAMVEEAMDEIRDGMYRHITHTPAELMRPILHDLADKALESFWAQGSMTYEEGRKLLNDLVSKVEFRTAKRFVDCEVQCPEPLCEGGYKDYPLKRHWKCHFCKGTMTVPLHVRDRWVAEQCADFVEDRESKHDHSDDNREDLTRYLQGSHDGRKLAANRLRTFADGRFSENDDD